MGGLGGLGDGFQVLSVARECRAFYCSLCSEVILVNADGRVVESGTHAELMTLKGVYYKLQMQSRK